MRRPRHFSEAWRACPDTYFGCRDCAFHLAPLTGPAADREPEVAGDRVPDPEGTVRALLELDAQALHRAVVQPDAATLRRAAGDAGPKYPPGSLMRLEEPMGRALRGIELRAPGGPVEDDHRRLDLTRFGLAWVPLLIDPVDGIELPPAGADADSVRLLRSPTAEKAFLVSIDRDGRWRLREVAADRR